MKVDLLLRNGYLLDPAAGLSGPGDLVIHQRRIVQAGSAAGDYQANQEVDLKGYLVLPGLIDIHAHLFPGRTALGLPPDQVGINQGVTTAVDAGSAGVDNLDAFLEVVRGAKTRVLAFVNLARSGLEQLRGELADPANLAAETLPAAFAAHPGLLRGIKVRASASVVGQQGIAPIRVGAEVARELGVPLMVHIGNAPPRLEEVLELLKPGDIVSHAFHGKTGGIFREKGLLPEARAAVERGVYLDVAHGQSSFSFRTMERYLAEGLFPDIISTDIWNGNHEAPVHSLAHTLSKLLLLGMPLEKVVAAATIHPARALGLADRLGSLAPGAPADVSILTLREGPVAFTDSEGEVRQGHRELVPILTVRAGTLWQAGSEHREEALPWNH